MYTTEQEQMILNLIKYRRTQLRDDKACLKKAKQLSEHQERLINEELEDLRKLEMKNRGLRML